MRYLDVQFDVPLPDDTFSLSRLERGSEGGLTGSTMSRIAWRNLWRNRRRTALALAAIGLSVTLVLLYDGILRAYGDWMSRPSPARMLGPRPGPRAAVAEGPRDGSDAAGRATRHARAAPARSRGGRATPASTPRRSRRSGQEGFAVVVMGVDMARSGAPAARGRLATERSARCSSAVSSRS